MHAYMLLNLHVCVTYRRSPVGNRCLSMSNACVEGCLSMVVQHTLTYTLTSIWEKVTVPCSVTSRTAHNAVCLLRLQALFGLGNRLPVFTFLCMPCRIHKEELGRRCQYAVTLFLGVGCILAVTIVHNNVTALVHGHDSQPAPHPPSILSQYGLAPVFRTRKFLQV